MCEVVLPYAFVARALSRFHIYIRSLPCFFVSCLSDIWRLSSPRPLVYDSIPPSLSIPLLFIGLYYVDFTCNVPLDKCVISFVVR